MRVGKSSPQVVHCTNTLQQIKPALEQAPRCCLGWSRRVRKSASATATTMELPAILKRAVSEIPSHASLPRLYRALRFEQEMSGFYCWVCLMRKKPLSIIKKKFELWSVYGGKDHHLGVNKKIEKKRAKLCHPLVVKQLLKKMRST